MEQSIWEQEQQHLTDISAMLKIYVDFLEKKQKRQKGEIIEERTFASSDFNDVSGERAVEFSQLLQSMELREMEYHHLYDQLAKAKVLYKSPYFGRISIKNEVGEDETLYIGLSTFRDPNTDDVHIFDWRAPISSLFYENKLGDANYAIPDGEQIPVEIIGRRQYKVLYDKLLQLLDAEIYIGDDVLQGLLKDTAKEKMKSIVATIQSDQNAVIRASNRRNVIVLGPPGSGKTSVAMQRIAYLLYEYRQHLNAKNILLISPSDLFNDYISNVLPELGEENVKHTTFYRIWKDAQIGRIYAETNYENIERIQKASQLERVSFRYKNSKQYADRLQRFVASLQDKGLSFYNLKIGEELLFSASELRGYFYSKFAGLDMDFRLKKIRTLLLNELQRRKEVAYKKRLKELQSVTNYIGSDGELEIQANNDVNKKYGKLQTLIEQLKFININKLYILSLTFENEDEQAKEIAKMTEQQLKNRILHYEDLGPMLYLEHTIKNLRTHPEIKHIVIDEIQDYSYIQLLAIQTIYPKAHFTLLGDKNQIVHPEKKDMLVEKELKTFDCVELNKSYRSTVEITDFMSAIMNQTSTMSLGVSGEKPTIFETSNKIATIRKLIEHEKEKDESFVIITKNMATCKKLYEELKVYIPDIRLITEEDKVYLKGVLLMPGYMAKGFEFTTVVLVDAESTTYQNDADATLLYTIVSRATRKLFVLTNNLENLPQSFKNVDEKLFVTL